METFLFGKHGSSFQRKRVGSLVKISRVTTFATILFFFSPEVCEGAQGIVFTNGQIAETSIRLFLTAEQGRQVAADNKVQLTPKQSELVGEFSFLRHHYITNLSVLTMAQAKEADVRELLNVGIEVGSNVLEVPITYLGKDMAERDRWKRIKLFSETSSSTRAQALDEDRRTLWFQLRYQIVDPLCEYFAKHPEHFKPVGSDDEIEIAGFAEFLANDKRYEGALFGYQVQNGRIYDPWGEPLHFIQKRGTGRTIKARGLEHIVMNTTRVGITSDINAKELLGVCKHSAKGYEDAPHNCIYVDVYLEDSFFKSQRLKKSAERK